jgi:RNA polymerase sigma-70 factor (ECF subfamily)
VDPDCELVERWRAGDRSAGQALFVRYFDCVYRFFKTKCDGELDELVQRTFLACVQSRDQFRGDSSFRTYVYTIARHELYRHYRQRQRHGWRFEEMVTSVAELVTTPRSRIARDEAHRQLLDAFCQLPINTQTLLELHYWEDVDIAALAAIFEAPAATIRTWLHRGRRALRDVLEAGALAPEDAVASLEALDAWARSSRPMSRGGDPSHRA